MTDPALSCLSVSMICSDMSTGAKISSALNGTASLVVTKVVQRTDGDGAENYANEGGREHEWMETHFRILSLDH